MSNIVLFRGVSPPPISRFLAKTALKYVTSERLRTVFRSDDVAPATIFIPKVH